MEILNSELVIVLIGSVFIMIAITGGGFKTKWFEIPNHIGLIGRTFSALVGIVCFGSMISSFICDIRVAIAPNLEKSAVEEVVIDNGEEPQSFNLFVTPAYGMEQTVRKQTLIVPETKKIKADIFGPEFYIAVNEVIKGEDPIIIFVNGNKKYLVPMETPTKVYLDKVKNDMYQMWGIDLVKLDIKLIFGVNGVDAVAFFIYVG